MDAVVRHVIDPKPPVRFCWKCSRKLRWARTKDGRAGFSYVEIRGSDGHLHPIHDACRGRFGDHLAATPPSREPGEGGAGG